MTRSILLADDSATIRKVVEVSFSDTDFRVEAVADGDAALCCLDTMRPDVVLADVVMPGPSGYDICRMIKSSERPIPVLLLAGTFEAFDHDLARECGADGCLLKPFEARTLLDRVSSLLADRDAIARSAVELLEESAAEVSEEGPPEMEAPVVVAAPVECEEAVEEEPPTGLSEEAIDAIARAVVRRLSTDAVREIAHEILPGVAERVVRERILELEDEES